MRWRQGPLKHWLDVNDSGVWGEDPDGLDDVEVLRSTDITLDGGWNIHDPALRSVSPFERAAKRLHAGDLVVVKSSGSEVHLGKTAIVTAEVAAREPCFANFVQRLRPSPTADSRYVWYVLNAKHASDEMAILGNTTTGLRNLNGTIIGQVTFPGAPLVEQRAIADFLDAETARIDALIEKKRRMVGLFEDGHWSWVSERIQHTSAPTVQLRRALVWITDGPFGSSLTSSHYSDAGARVVIPFRSIDVTTPPQPPPTRSNR